VLQEEQLIILAVPNHVYPYRRVQELASALVEDLQIYTPQGGDALVHKATCWPQQILTATFKF